MPDNNSLAPHEILELKELLSSEVLAMKKLQTSSSVVKDEQLKSYIETCMDSKKNKISDIQKFIQVNPM